jgi:hypothetical protein
MEEARLGKAVELKVNGAERTLVMGRMKLSWVWVDVWFFEVFWLFRGWMDG